jgi:hypothetical protein
MSHKNVTKVVMTMASGFSVQSVSWFKGSTFEGSEQKKEGNIRTLKPPNPEPLNPEPKN